MNKTTLKRTRKIFHISHKHVKSDDTSKLLLSKTQKIGRLCIIQKLDYQ